MAEVKRIHEIMSEAASKGRDHFVKVWKSLKPSERKDFGQDNLKQFEEVCKQADEAANG